MRRRPIFVRWQRSGDHGCTSTAAAAKWNGREVPAAALQWKMLPQIENFLDDLLSWPTLEISWTQRYAVEASTRMLYTLERGEVISKQDALDWGTVAMSAEWAT
jgi:hypothetical protein